MTVWVVATSAAGRSLAKTLRTFQRFHDKCRLAESSVLVKTLPREFTEGKALILAEEGSGAGVIEFTAPAEIAQRRLHMTLRANGYKVLVADLSEVDRRIERLLVVCGAVGDGRNVER